MTPFLFPALQAKAFASLCRATGQQWLALARSFDEAGDAVLGDAPDAAIDDGKVVVLPVKPRP